MIFSAGILTCFGAIIALESLNASVLLWMSAQGNSIMQIKSHESPRSQGRNSKGKGGSARKRQIDKRNRQLRNQLKKDRSAGAVFLCPIFIAS